MKGMKHSMLVATVVAGFGMTAQAADDAGKQAGGQSQQGISQQDPAAQPQQQLGQDPAAQQAGARQSGQQQGAMSPDAMFVKHAAIGNLKEAKLAEIALQKSQTQEVKDIAQQIKQDHQQAQQKLQELAQQVGVQVPRSLPQEKQEAISYFQSLEGKQFDQEYLSALKAHHAAAISMCQDRAQIAENPQVKQYAQEGVAKLQQHQQQVLAAAEQVGLPGGTATAAGQGTDTARPAGQRIGDSPSDLGGQRDPAQPSDPSRSPTDGSGSGSGVGQPGSTGGTATPGSSQQPQPTP